MQGKTTPSVKTVPKKNASHRKNRRIAAVRILRPRGLIADTTHKPVDSFKTANKKAFRTNYLESKWYTVAGIVVGLL